MFPYSEKIRIIDSKNSSIKHAQFDLPPAAQPHPHAPGIADVVHPRTPHAARRCAAAGHDAVSREQDAARARSRRWRDAVRPRGPRATTQSGRPCRDELLPQPAQHDDRVGARTVQAAPGQRGEDLHRQHHGRSPRLPERCPVGNQAHLSLAVGGGGDRHQRPADRTAARRQPGYRDRPPAPPRRSD